MAAMARMCYCKLSERGEAAKSIVGGRGLFSTIEPKRTRAQLCPHRQEVIQELSRTGIAQVSDREAAGQ